ncbi:SPFH domain-containing protein [Neomegalonema sp.]|uniref:SPFH domain-containing protein n=1 Tax=Neomegalonema sp. TaxID=2039713 RepID=UPI00261A9041|nr:SPFH domain-containing protein [Neomegalonema sp.]MDD2870048.1 SPFH/Band 7/PHB domain protein [Neomegalonema sp.]
MELAAILVLVALVLITLFLAVRTVPQGEQWTVERFGRYTRTLQPGLNLLVPYVDNVGKRLSMKEELLDVPEQDVITRDNVMVRTDAVVFFQILDASAAAYEVGNLASAIINLAISNIRTVIGGMELDDVLTRRDEINKRLLNAIDEATEAWGVKVTRVEIRDLSPPPDIADSMARQMKAERDKRAEILEAEGAKQSAVLKAEGAKQAAVLRAEGEKEAAIRAAEGRREAAFRDAEARERAAIAEAEATRVVSESIGAHGVQAIQYFVAQKYVDSLKEMASAENSKIIMMPLEASGILGSVSGVTELLKATGAVGTGKTGA